MRNSLVAIGQGHLHLNIRLREVTGAAIHRALEPIVVDAIQQGDNVVLLEGQFAGILRLEVVEGLAAGLLLALRHINANIYI